MKIISETKPEPIKVKFDPLRYQEKINYLTNLVTQSKEK